MSKKQKSADLDPVIDRQNQPEMEIKYKGRWLCNELVCEFCSAIPALEASDQILLTSFNIYTYLEAQFKSKLIYRDAIAFVKAKLKNQDGEKVKMCIQAIRDNDILIHQKQSEEKFELQTNHLRIRIGTQKSSCIDSVGLTGLQFNSAPVQEALANCHELTFYLKALLLEDDVPMLVQWLNTNTTGQLKKCFFTNRWYTGDGLLSLLLHEIQQDFVRASNKCPFVVRLRPREPLPEFTLCNERERLELRGTEISRYGLSYALRRHSVDNEHECSEIKPSPMATITIAR